jgi:chromosome segregation ATPase
MSDSFISTGSSSSAPVTEFRAEISRFGFLVHDFVPIGEFKSRYAELGNKTIQIKAKLTKTSQDHHRIGDAVIEMAEKNRKLVQEIQGIELDKQTFLKRLASVTAKIDYSELKITEKENAFQAIGNEHQKTEKKLLIAKVELYDANRKPVDLKYDVETLINDKGVSELETAELIEQNKKSRNHTHEEQLLQKKTKNEIPMQRNVLEKTVMALEKIMRQREEYFKRRANEMDKKSSEVHDKEAGVFLLTREQETIEKEAVTLALKQDDMKTMQTAMMQGERSTVESPAGSITTVTKSSSRSQVSVKPHAKVSFSQLLFCPRLLTTKAAVSGFKPSPR